MTFVSLTFFPLLSPSFVFLERERERDREREGEGERERGREGEREGEGENLDMNIFYDFLAFSCIKSRMTLLMNLFSTSFEWEGSVNQRVREREREQVNE